MRGGDVLLSNRPATLAVASMASVAIGGCMMPLEVFSSVMRRVAHVTPQAWGNDAFAKLVGHGASVAGILPSPEPTVTVGVLKETTPGEQRVAVVPPPWWRPGTSSAGPASPPG
jgi:hypothetical protein